ncbi:type VII secretion protein EccB [Pseudonocardia sp. NPDC046786]|uniref:type VII secretion protein EccB n=1 Tax=Pseudonocardia sp. NPDC046786 TaxID=3155471 RepID=UPI0033D320C2
MSPDPDRGGPEARVQRAPATTRDQVDAYRFGLRRMEAALVRADPVPLHEQLRAQRRAVFAGVLVGLLALGVTALLARHEPAPDWRRLALVRGERSGVLYAVTPEPPRLVPVPDALGGRLVLAALGRTDGADAVPVAVPDEALAGAPRTPPAAVPAAFGAALDGTAVPAAWAVCDSPADPADGGSAEPSGPVGGTATVLAGSLGAVPAGPPSAVLLSIDGGATYLVHDGRRHRLDLADRAVLDGLGLLGAGIRRAGEGLLSAIPEGPPLRLPDDPGEVVVDRPLGGPAGYHLRTADGLAPIPVTLADAVLSRTGQGAPAELPPGAVAAAPARTLPGAAAWPAARVTVAGAPVLCRTWRDGRGGLFLGDRLPVADGAVPVALAGADGPGPRLDAVVLPRTGPGPLRAAPAGGAGGTRWLLASSGAVFGVADDPTAAALGIGEPGAAPAELVRLLPRAGALDLAAARDTTDVPG